MTTSIQVIAHCDSETTVVSVRESTDGSASNTVLKDGEVRDFIVYDDKSITVQEVPVTSENALEETTVADAAAGDMPTSNDVNPLNPETIAFRKELSVYVLAMAKKASEEYDGVKALEFANAANSLASCSYCL